MLSAVNRRSTVKPEAIELAVILSTVTNWIIFQFPAPVDEFLDKVIQRI
jgi:hypothetical protein